MTLIDPVSTSQATGSARGVGEVVTSRVLPQLHPRLRRRRSPGRPYYRHPSDLLLLRSNSSKFVGSQALSLVKTIDAQRDWRLLSRSVLWAKWHTWLLIARRACRHESRWVA